MLSTFDLWLPILLSGVAVFVVSSFVHMLLPIHAGDYKRLPDETDRLATLRGIAPGSYRFPYCSSMKELEAPGMLERYKQGPVGLLTLLPSGPPKMGGALFLWFVYCLVIGVFVAYIGAFALRPGAASGEVFRICTTLAFLGYGLGQATDSIWKGQSWIVSFKFAFDGLLYALATGAVFCWMWPAAII